MTDRTIYSRIATARRNMCRDCAVPPPGARLWLSAGSYAALAAYDRLSVFNGARYAFGLPVTVGAGGSDRISVPDGRVWPI